MDDRVAQPDMARRGLMTGVPEHTECKSTWVGRRCSHDETVHAGGHAGQTLRQGHHEVGSRRDLHRREEVWHPHLHPPFLTGCGQHVVDEG